MTAAHLLPNRGSLMPKALCLFSLVVAILILLLFLSDLILSLAGQQGLAPLDGANLMMDGAFALFGALIAFLSWSTLREQT